LSLRGGFRFAAYVRQQTSLPLANFHPFVSVIAPSRGLETGLVENIRPLLEQDYPNYEVLLVFDSSEDPALAAVEKLLTERGSAKIVIAGPATDTGQKVHNLQFAVGQIAPQSEVLAFVDTDARPNRRWLKQLVAPLHDETLGASTGYRWFVPERGGLASRLRSVWNASIASALGAATAKNFCWGGSTAIRRATFEQLKVRERWRGSISDDYTMTECLKEARLPIHFNPNCLVASIGDCSFRELVEFTTRQIKITRVYAPHLWQPLLLGSALFTIVFFGGLTLVLLRLVLGLPFLVLLAVLLLVWALGAAKALIRWWAICISLPDHLAALRRDLLAQVVLWPFASLLYLYNAIAAGFSQRIEWRGITYELKSPTEAVIISRNS
ncbi:MAG TPA: glycosyltransferase family 2 protein, partial [Pyrinomonadaceae bacterium]|nr:glycosyltransferase family 2 protein [Pyrinomonadaceae bacterium]